MFVSSVPCCSRLILGNRAIEKLSQVAHPSSHSGQADAVNDTATAQAEDDDDDDIGVD